MFKRPQEETEYYTSNGKELDKDTADKLLNIGSFIELEKEVEEDLYFLEEFSEALFLKIKEFREYRAKGAKVNYKDKFENIEYIVERINERIESLNK